MPTIKSSADLRNDYNRISNFCHQYSEPVFITKNGYGRLVVMDIDYYQRTMQQIEEANAVNAGLDDLENGRLRAGHDVLREMKDKYHV